MVINLIISLFLTLIIEITISFILEIRDKYNIIIITCANVCTNPLVVYISGYVNVLFYDIYFLTIIILELLAIIVEFLIFKKYLIFDKISPLKLSIINNVLSFFIGVLINNFI